MALQFAHGAIQWLAADAVSTVYTVSGLAFVPKAIRVYWQGLGSAVDAVSATVSSRRGVGFGTSTTDRCCVGTEDQDGVPTMVCTSGHSTSAIAMTVSGVAANGLLDLNSITSDGFTLIVDDQGVVDITIFWEAWGGDAIGMACTGTVREPAGTGNQSHVTAIQCKPSVLMFAGIMNTAVNTVARFDSGLCIGFASSDRAANNVVIVGSSDDASTTADTDLYCQTGECIAAIVSGGGNATARAKLVSFDQAGFTLNWIARALTDRITIYLAIQGGQWEAGAYTIEGNSASATATVSGLTFAPIGICTIGVMTAQPAAGTSAVQDRLGMGTGTSTSSRRCMGHLSEDNSTSASSVAEIDLTIQYDQVLAFPAADGTLLAACDINSMDKDGFSIIVDVAGGVASEWQGYLAFGGKAAVTFNNYMHVHALNSDCGIGEVTR